jgi:glyoxylate/hydroxypyruvate reductase
VAESAKAIKCALHFCLNLISCAESILALENIMHAPIPYLFQGSPAKAQAWLAQLARAMPAETILTLDQLSDQERTQVELAIVANPDPLELKTLPNLKWVHSLWAGVERLVADLHDSPLPIVRLVDPQLAATMAEAVLAWTLYLHRDMPTYARQQAARLWQAHPYVRPERKTVGLLGLGALGQAAAQKLLGAGFQVCGWRRSAAVPDASLGSVTVFSGADGLSEMLRRSTILVCLLPLTPETRGLLDAKALAQLPQGGALINFARGPIVDNAALLAALDSGALGHAVLDVFEQEPLPVDSPLWAHPGVTVLPHISGPTDLETGAQIVAQNIALYRANGCIPAGVDRVKGY